MDQKFGMEERRTRLKRQEPPSGTMILTTCVVSKAVVPEVGTHLPQVGYQVPQGSPVAAAQQK